MFRIIALSLLVCVSAAGAQPVPSSYTPLNPCRIFDSRADEQLEGDTTTFLHARGLCNVPESANAVFVTVMATGGMFPGYLTIWGGETARPAGITMTFNGASLNSSGAFVRLCYPAEECFEDLAVYTCSTTDVVLDVVGYTEPLP